jgi:polo-like kinase 3
MFCLLLANFLADVDTDDLPILTHFFSCGLSSCKHNTQQMWGTAEYFAPEVINQAYGPQADVWALGCVMYEMLCGEQAFPAREGDKKATYYARICEGKYDLKK